MIPLLFVIGIVIGIAVAVVRYRGQTSERGIESGIASFRREMHALAPPDDDTSEENR